MNATGAASSRVFPPPAIRPGLRGLDLLNAVIEYIESGGRWDQRDWAWCVAGLACRIAGDVVTGGGGCWWIQGDLGQPVMISTRARDLFAEFAEQIVTLPCEAPCPDDTLPAPVALFNGYVSFAQIKAVRDQLAVARRRQS